MFAIEILNDSNFFISWSLPTTKIHDHIEVYYGTSVIESFRDKGRKIKLKHKNSSYAEVEKLEGVNYYSIYNVDVLGRYSEPKTVSIIDDNISNESQKKTFDYHFYDDKLKLLIQKLENEFITVHLSRGVIISLENKLSNNQIFSTNFNFSNSYLTPMDIYANDDVTFSLYRSSAKIIDLSYIHINKTSNNEIEYTRKYTDLKNKFEKIKYTLQDKSILIDFESNIDSKKYTIRVNFLGNDDFKSITSWKTKNVNSVIDEPKYDETSKEYINSKYSLDSNLTYHHKENIFNDVYPYHDSRKFLKIDSLSKFELYNQEEHVFSISNISENYFFYKNCSGEECFTFGQKHPYSSHITTIKNKFHLKLDVEY
jgi:hypothetical protein